MDIFDCFVHNFVTEYVMFDPYLAQDFIVFEIDHLAYKNSLKGKFIFI